MCNGVPLMTCHMQLEVIQNDTNIGAFDSVPDDGIMSKSVRIAIFEILDDATPN